MYVSCRNQLPAAPTPYLVPFEQRTTAVCENYHRLVCLCRSRCHLLQHHLLVYASAWLRWRPHSWLCPCRSQTYNKKGLCVGPTHKPHLPVQSLKYPIVTDPNSAPQCRRSCCLRVPIFRELETIVHIYMRACIHTMHACIH